MKLIIHSVNDLVSALIKDRYVDKVYLISHKIIYHALFSTCTVIHLHLLLKLYDSERRTFRNIVNKHCVQSMIEIKYLSNLHISRYVCKHREGQHGQVRLKLNTTQEKSRGFGKTVFIILNSVKRKTLANFSLKSNW